MSSTVADYFPYGKVLREFNPQAEKYLTTHHERDTETGLDYRGARYYDSDIARFGSLDPLAADFAAWSSYNYVLGNPLNFIDPDGKDPQNPDDFVFDQNGDFNRIVKNDKPDKIVIQNTTTGKKEGEYAFADPVEDPKQIRNGTINKLIFQSAIDVGRIIGMKGAFNPDNRNNYSFMYNESKGGGDLDFSYTSIPTKFSSEGASGAPMNSPSPMLFIVENTGFAQNHMNFGNFLWGASGYSLGFEKPTLLQAAHFNSIFNSATNGYSPQWDSSDDQLSISLGASFSKANNFRSLNWTPKTQ